MEVGGCTTWTRFRSFFEPVTSAASSRAPATGTLALEWAGLEAGELGRAGWCFVPASACERSCRTTGVATATPATTTAVAAILAAAPPKSDLPQVSAEPTFKPQVLPRERSSLRASERRARKRSVSTAASEAPSSPAISR